MDIAGATQELIDKLTAAKIRAVQDLGDLNPPAVLIPPPQLTARFGKGWEAQWEIAAAWLDAGAKSTTKGLGELIEAIQAALGWPITTGRPDTILQPQGAPIPVYRLAFTTRIPPAKEA